MLVRPRGHVRHRLRRRGPARRVVHDAQSATDLPVEPVAAERHLRAEVPADLLGRGVGRVVVRDVDVVRGVAARVVAEREPDVHVVRDLVVERVVRDAAVVVVEGRSHVAELEGRRVALDVRRLHVEHVRVAEHDCDHAGLMGRLGRPGGMTMHGTSNRLQMCGAEPRSQNRSETSLCPEQGKPATPLREGPM